LPIGFSFLTTFCIGRRSRVQCARSAATESDDLCPLTAGLTTNETPDFVPSDVVSHLLRRTFHEIGADADQRSADPSITRQLAAANRVDDDSGRIGAVLDGEAELQLDWGSAETATFNAEEADLVVLLPRYVVARPDVHGVRG
jgi:hypothetical protein